MIANGPNQCCRGGSGSRYRRDCCHGENPPDHCHRYCCPGHCDRRGVSGCGCQSCRRRCEEIEEERRKAEAEWKERDRIRREKAQKKREDRERRMMNPNYVPTAEDKVDDALGAATVSLGVSLVACVVLGVFRFIKWGDLD